MSNPRHYPPTTSPIHKVHERHLSASTAESEEEEDKAIVHYIYSAINNDADSPNWKLLPSTEVYAERRQRITTSTTS